ncbi:SusC/RagA family TonB-linked outer membrane protein [Pedobacter hartonius]|uniref:TonB-linked outer membrane protein, SusC/RagA family n=1 Tax=Pedobacter hartonius TaxID=425514 RepID=A0A1H4E786_9SPHI|nr:TonB-dependent receptor [Pedobacter hartonius]SEA80934.1 TonB-linked outer membrane protein, SusC/RagA family [Pedobacter hartonius]
MRRAAPIFMLLLLILTGLQSFAQSQVVGGTVTDDLGQTLTGATVKLKGSSMGVVTAIDGKYSISVPDNGILIFSYVGMAEKSVPVNKRRVINVQLISNSASLNDVVVVGYGTVRKSDLTGSVAKFKTDNLEQYPVTSIDQAIQGKVSGVQIVNSSGSPGAGLSFVVRGGNSLGSNQPLIILDGYPIDLGSGNLSMGANNEVANQPGQNPLAALNPNDVESIEILKDASSTAIYGSRGANGVVIITTKRGKKGVDQINFSFRSDAATIRKKLPVLNTQDFIKFSNEGALNDGIDSIYKAPAIAALGGINNNWQDQIFRTGVTNNYQLSVSGGDDKNKYFLSGEYTKINGPVYNSNLNRGNIRFNYDRTVNKALTVKFNVTATKSASRLGLNSAQSGLQSSNVIGSALLSRPLTRGVDDVGEIDQSIADNPLTVLNLQKDNTNLDLVSSNLTADLKLTKDLIFRTNVGGYNTSSLRQSYSPVGTYVGSQLNGYAFRGESSRFNYLSEFTLNYAKSINKHSINAVAGYTWQKWDQKGLGTSASGFPNDNLTYESFQSAKSPGITTTAHQQWALASYLGRFNYAFDNRYLLTLTGRADGSTKLAEGHKYTFFPSAAVAWKVSEEDFFKDNVKFISSFKLRASYGLSGNQNIAVGGTQTTFGIMSYVLNGQVVKGYVQNNIANPVLGWEKTKQFNAGADISFMHDKLQLEVNVYKKRTDDLLISLPIPANTGYTNYLSNAGSVENKGLELDLSAQILRSAFKWDVSGNISFNRNKLVSLGPLGDDGKIFGPNYLSAGSLLNQPIHIGVLNQPVGSFYGYRINGIYQTAAEVAAGPEAGTAKPGDFRFVDLNGDNIINADDRQIVGNPNPDYIFGLTNSFSYKKFTFSFFIQGSIGNQIANLNRFRLDALAGNATNISQEAFDGRWTGPGTSNYYPRAKSGGGYFSSRFSDFLIEDGSYVRLKNVNVSYSLPLAKISWVKDIKIFLTATNLLTFTNYTGFDPEVNADYGNGLTQGVDNGTYPQYRTLTAGINLKF